MRSGNAEGVDKGRRDRLDMPGLVNNEYRSTKQDAVQKGRLPRSPLEGSMVDQLMGIQQQQNHGGVHTNNQHISAYTTLLLRADNLVRLQQQSTPQQHHHNQQLQLNLNSMNNIYEAATKLLLSAVDWARNVPFFSALPTADQFALLKSSWSELYILSTSQHCATYQINVRNLVPVYYKENNISIDQQSKRSIVEQCKIFEELVDKFKSLQTDPAEFSYLKALVLFNPDSPGVGNPTLIESLQEKAQAALEDYLRHQPTANYTNRFGKLLLRLPALSLIRPTTIESLFFPRLVGHQTMDNLVGSMLFHGAQSNNSIPSYINFNNNNNNNNNNQQQQQQQQQQHNMPIGSLPSGMGINTNNLANQISPNMSSNLQNVNMSGILNGNLNSFQQNSNHVMNFGNLPNNLQYNIVQQTHYQGSSNQQSMSSNNNQSSMNLNAHATNQHLNAGLLTQHQSTNTNKPVHNQGINESPKDYAKDYCKLESSNRI